MVDICQDHVRKVLEAVRELPLLIDSCLRNDLPGINDHYNRIVKLEEEATSLKRVLTRELTEAGAILLSREDFLRLVALNNEIADAAGGVAFRLAEIHNRGWKLDKKVLDSIARLADAILDSTTRLRETIFSLSYTTSKTAELAKNVEAAERIADAVYRKVDLLIISSNMKMPLILITRDVAQLLEEMADKAEDAADAACILALSAF
jgi:predicted phosphate transport protein (TIGR00153 family)